jgi:hypothetical protein
LLLQRLFLGDKAKKDAISNLGVIGLVLLAKKTFNAIAR